MLGNGGGLLPYHSVSKYLAKLGLRHKSLGFDYSGVEIVQVRQDLQLPSFLPFSCACMHVLEIFTSLLLILFFQSVTTGSHVTGDGVPVHLLYLLCLPGSFEGVEEHTPFKISTLRRA